MLRRIKNAISFTKAYSFRTYLEMITYGKLRKHPETREKLFEKYFLRREKKILKFTPSIIDESKNYQPGLKISSDYKIWMFWWTGFETAPELIRDCAASAKKTPMGMKMIGRTGDHGELHPLPCALRKNTAVDHSSIVIITLQKIR